MSSGATLGIVLAVIAVIGFGIWYSTNNMYPNGSSEGGGNKHIKHPTKINLVLALIFAYIVYKMFYNY